MKVYLVGATGRVGTAVLSRLLAANQQVIAASRHPERIVAAPNVTPQKLDLHASMQTIAQQMGQVDAVMFVAGSRGKDLLQTDAFGAVKVMQAAQQNGVKRFIMLSSLAALEPEKWTTNPKLAALMDYNIAKFFADNYLISNTDLAYTIIQPGTLSEGAPTGTLSFNQVLPQANAIGDVATLLVQCLTHTNTIKRVLKVTGGPTPIATGIAAIK